MNCSGVIDLRHRAGVQVRSKRSALKKYKALTQGPVGVDDARECCSHSGDGVCGQAAAPRAPAEDVLRREGGFAQFNSARFIEEDDEAEADKAD